MKHYKWFIIGGVIISIAVLTYVLYPTSENIERLIKGGGFSRLGGQLYSAYLVLLYAFIGPIGALVAQLVLGLYLMYLDVRKWIKK